MKITVKYLSIVLFLSISVLYISFGGQEAEWKGKIEKRDGITVIKNPKEPMYGEDVFSLEEELTIGGEDKDSKPLFIDITYVRVDYEENIYVLDSRDCQIKVFDKNGKHIRKIGRKGQGPGEMQFPTMMDIVSGKELMICDLRNNRISFYSLQGELLKEISKGTFLRLFTPMPDSNKNFIGSMRFQIGKKRVDELMKFDSNFRKIFTIEKLEYTDEPNVIYPYPPFILYTVLEDDKVLWGNWLYYQLQIVDEEVRVTKKIIKDYDPVIIPDEEKERDIKERFEGVVPLDIKIIFPKYYPAFWHFSTDDEGRIFIQTFEKTEAGSHYFDVFDPEGKYIAKAPLKVRPQTWKKNKLYTIEEDEDGYQYVKRYKVTWKY